MCGAGEDLYECRLGAGASSTVCGASATEAGDDCDALGGSLGDKTTCDGQGSGGETGAQSWDPGSNVYYDSTRVAYVIDATFWAGLVAEPDQLLFDGARLAEQADHDFEFVSVGSNDFAYQLGLRTGDEPLSIDGYSLATVDDMFTAWHALKNDDTVILTIRRSGNNMRLKYIVE